MERLWTDISEKAEARLDGAQPPAGNEAAVRKCPVLATCGG
jgi:hypothetical protein